MSKFFKALEQAERDRSQPVEGESPTKAASPPAPAREPVTLLARMRIEPSHEAEVPQAPQRAAESPEIQPPPTDQIDGIESHLVGLIAPTAFESEQYRNLRTLLETMRGRSHGYVVAVSSPGVGDGKTTTAINLAGVLAEGENARVLLIDADLRNPSVHRKLGMKMSRGRGLMSMLTDGARPLQDVVTSRPPFRLMVLPAERSVSSPYEMLKSQRFGAMLDDARRLFDYVVLDTPPMVSLSDCRLIGNWVDGFLIVVAANRTPRKLLEEALDSIEPSKVVGFVFNNDERSFAKYRYYAYGYTGDTVKSPFDES